MSAYVCHTDTIDYLVALAGAHNGSAFYLQGPYADRQELIEAGIITADRDRIIWNEHQVIGAILHHQNVRSVNEKYDDQTPTTGYVARPVWSPEGVIALKSIACLRYQSCETDDYADTLAYAVLDWLKNCAINRLAGYEDAPWGWTRAYAAEREAAVRARTAAAMGLRLVTTEAN